MATNTINRIYEVISTTLNMREGPSTSFPAKGALKKGDRVTATKEQSGWFQIGNGLWVSSGYSYLKLIEDILKNVKDSTAKSIKDSSSGGTSSPSGASTSTSGGPSNFSGLDDGSGGVTMPEGMTEKDFNSPLEGDDYSDYQADINAYQLYNSRSQTASGLSSIRGIHGFPYQFMDSVDQKLSNFDSGINFPYGRRFTEKIVNRMPLLLLAPGRPSFMDGYKKSERGAILSAIMSAGTNESALEDMFDTNKFGRYYTFRFNYADYYDYVNGVCRASAIYLGLGDKTIDGTPYSRYSWDKFTNDGLKGFFSGSEYVAFYVDADNQISESFSNSTGESMLSNSMNTLSNMGKEIDFLLGAGFGVKADLLNEDKVAQSMADASNALLSFSNPANVLERLKAGALTIAAGGKLIFPEIWQDSSYSKSYSVNIKLTSPDGDTESIYRNILVPMWHLIALALPMQMGYNGMRSPFLVKGVFKGLFNCEMGIITNMDIQKGGEGSWNIDGLPTEVQISFTIKDLYQALTMTKGKDLKMFFNNTQYLDFIATMCGIAIIKPEIAMKMEMYSAFLSNKAIDLPNRAMLKLHESVSNASSKILGWTTR